MACWRSTPRGHQAAPPRSADSASAKRNTIRRLRACFSGGGGGSHVLTHNATCKRPAQANRVWRWLEDTSARRQTGCPRRRPTRRFVVDGGGGVRVCVCDAPRAVRLRTQVFVVGGGSREARTAVGSRLFCYAPAPPDQLRRRRRQRRASRRGAAPVAAAVNRQNEGNT